MALDDFQEPISELVRSHLVPIPALIATGQTFEQQLDATVASLFPIRQPVEIAGRDNPDTR